MALAEAPSPTFAPVQVTSKKIRLDYLDALKVALTALVIAHHAGQPYGPTGGRWPIFNAEQSGILGPFFAVNAAFFMGLFFLMSAYFVPASFDRKGARRFLADRAIRLGVPLLAIGLLIGALEGQAFDPAHLWFVAHLLVYAVLYTVLRMTHVRKVRAIPTPTHRSILSYAVGLSIVTAAVRLAGFPQDRWVTVLGVVPIEVAHLPQYASLFVIGLLAARNGWLWILSRRTGLTWLGVGVALAVLRYAWPVVVHTPPTVWLWSVWESFLCVGMCVGLLVLLRDYGQTLTARLRGFAPNAYGAYVLHVMPVVVGLQFALAQVAIDPFVKFLLVTVAGVPLSFWLAATARRLTGVRTVL
jgi:Acyltransferase family